MDFSGSVKRADAPVHAQWQPQGSGSSADHAAHPFFERPNAAAGVHMLLSSEFSGLRPERVGRAGYSTISHLPCGRKPLSEQEFSPPHRRLMCGRDFQDVCQSFRESATSVACSLWRNSADRGDCGLRHTAWMRKMIQTWRLNTALHQAGRFTFRLLRCEVLSIRVTLTIAQRAR